MRYYQKLPPKHELESLLAGVFRPKGLRCLILGVFDANKGRAIVHLALETLSEEDLESDGPGAGEGGPISPA